MTMKTKAYEVAIKSLKVMESLSEETLCFTANIYVDGKKAGTASNCGHGGCTDYHFDDRKLEQDVDAWTKTLPPREYELPCGKGKTVKGSYRMNLEHYIDDLVYAEYNRKQDQKEVNKFNRALKSKTHFRVKGQACEAGACRTLGNRNHPFPATDPRTEAYLVKKYGKDGYVILHTYEALMTAQKGA